MAEAVVLSVACSSTRDNYRNNLATTTIFQSPFLLEGKTPCILGPLNSSQLNALLGTVSIRRTCLCSGFHIFLNFSSHRPTKESSKCVPVYKVTYVFSVSATINLYDYILWPEHFMFYLIFSLLWHTDDKI